MSKKNDNTRVSVNSFEKYYKTFDNGTHEVELSKDACKLVFHVRPCVNLTELGSACMTIAESCFKDKQYRAWFREYATRRTVIDTYTDIRMPEDVNRAFDFIMGTDVYEGVVSNIDEDQYTMLITAVDEQIDALIEQYNSSREQELDEALTMLRIVAQKYNELIVLCNEIAGDEIKGLAARLQESAKDVTDEVAAVREKVNMAQAAAAPQGE